MEIIGLSPSLRRSLLGQQNLVNDVDDAVGALNVGFRHLGIVDPDSALVADDDLLAVNRLDLCTIGQLGCVGGHDLAWHRMVRQDGNELLLVLGLQQALYGTFGKLGECFVRRSEDCERTFAFQPFDESCSLDCGNQRFEGSGLDGGVYDVMLLIMVAAPRSANFRALFNICSYFLSVVQVLLVRSFWKSGVTPSHTGLPHEECPMFEYIL